MGSAQSAEVHAPDIATSAAAAAAGGGGADDAVHFCFPHAYPRRNAFAGDGSASAFARAGAPLFRHPSLPARDATAGAYIQAQEEQDGSAYGPDEAPTLPAAAAAAIALRLSAQLHAACADAEQLRRALRAPPPAAHIVRAPATACCSLCCRHMRRRQHPAPPHHSRGGGGEGEDVHATVSGPESALGQSYSRHSSFWHEGAAGEDSQRDAPPSPARRARHATTSANPLRRAAVRHDTAHEDFAREQRARKQVKLDEVTHEEGTREEGAREETTRDEAAHGEAEREVVAGSSSKRDGPLTPSHPLAVPLIPSSPCSSARSTPSRAAEGATG